MDRSFFVIANADWLYRAGSHPKHIAKKDLCPIGRRASHLNVRCELLVKVRDQSGRIRLDDSAELRQVGDEYFIKSAPLCRILAERDAQELVAFFVEGTPTQARAVVELWDEAFLTAVQHSDPTLRLPAYGLPPRDATSVDSPRLLRAIYRAAVAQDRELFAPHASQFLDSPSILVSLLERVTDLRSEDNVNFSIQVKKIAEQIRTLLGEGNGTIALKEIKRSHLDLWAEMQDQRIAFLDGGVARIPGLANLEPRALRVGIYAVTPGVVDHREREQWSMSPYVIGDLLDPERRPAEPTDPRRLLEAARYVLEPLTGLRFLREGPGAAILLLHGPLVNQFLMYDEGEPNFIPFVDPDFLHKMGVERSQVEAAFEDLPIDGGTGESLWNQFMAVYGYVLRMVMQHSVPIVGVVERGTGRPLSISLLSSLLRDRVVTEAYVKRVETLLAKYDISDDFLFGCILREGEYLTPIEIQKNSPRRARERWKPVVRVYPRPKATMIKTAEMRFPFRVEFNSRAAEDHPLLLSLIFHTSRLLPQYAFPVGLDIADKYAKVPDWIARGVSAELSASVLRRAIKSGDARLVAQVRQLLSKSPRDFFFRPKA